MSEENKALVRRFLEENYRRQTVPEEFYTSACITHAPGRPPMDVASHTQFGGLLYAAVSNVKYTIEELIAEGETVAVRGTIRGSLPTGEDATATFMGFYRVAAGKFAEEWYELDLTGVMQMIGATPSQ